MIPLKKANILIPHDVDMTKWSVIACDQYTSQNEYWDKVKEIVGNSPSTLNITLPEIYLNDNDVSDKIKKINENMEDLLQSGCFTEYKDNLIYLERTQDDGRVRKGIIGMVDLEDYSYLADSTSLIKATEKTVVDRIPPRLRVRENALLETPHVMLLIDDPKKEIIDNLNESVSEEDKIYDFDLMLKGGHVKGYKLNDNLIEEIFNKLETFTDKETFEKKYDVTDKPVLLFSVGDGNHSLATAKAHYEKLKETLSKEEYLNHPARYALVEVVNLHSEALEFEPIHRVLFNVDVDGLLTEFKNCYHIDENDTEGQRIEYVCEGERKVLYVKRSCTNSNLAVGTLQSFLDNYLKNHPETKIDYIHDDDATIKLGREKGNIAFLLPAMSKNELFRTVILDGALPRKTFSMGHSYDKRYYLECRKIK